LAIDYSVETHSQAYAPVPIAALLDNVVGSDTTPGLSMSVTVATNTDWDVVVEVATLVGGPRLNPALRQAIRFRRPHSAVAVIDLVQRIFVQLTDTVGLQQIVDSIVGDGSALAASITVFPTAADAVGESGLNTATVQIAQQVAGNSVETYVATVAALLSQGGIGYVVSNDSVVAFDALPPNGIGVDQHLTDHDITTIVVLLVPTVADAAIESALSIASAKLNDALEYEAPLQLIDISDEFVPS
jgi:hypothetical protein